jgi:hypothetical protein
MSVESVLQRVALLEQALSNPAALLAAAARTGGTAAPAALSGTTPEAGSATSGSFAEALQSASASANYAGSPTTSATALASATGAAPASATGAALDASTAPSLGASTNPSLASATDAGLASPTDPGLASATLAGAYAPALASQALSLGAPGASTGARIVAIAESQLGQSEQPPGSNESPAIAQYRSATAGATPGAPWCAYFASWAAREAGAPLGAQGEGLGSVSEIWSWAQSTGRAIPNGPGVVPQPGDLIVFGGEHVGIVKAVLPDGDIQTVEGNYENKVSENVRTPSEATGYVNMN